MAKLFISALIFGLSLQITCYLFWAFNFFGGLITYPLGDVSSLTEKVFVLNVNSGLLAVVGMSAIGIAAFLLKQGTYAIYAMLIFAIGCMVGVVQSFFLAIPNTIGALFPPETNPNPTAFSVNPIIIAISAIFVFAAWMYFFGLVIQREAT
jgi:hypothetical protein